MKALAAIFTLLISFNSICDGISVFSAQISPSNIDEQTDILVGINVKSCRILSQDFYMNIDGNNIQFVFASVGYSPCPPANFLYNYNIGTLPVGEYTITTYQMYGLEVPTDPFDSNIELIQVGDPIIFGINEPVAVPALGIWGLYLLAISFILISFIASRKNPQVLK